MGCLPAGLSYHPESFPGRNRTPQPPSRSFVLLSTRFKEIESGTPQYSTPSPEVTKLTVSADRERVPLFHQVPRGVISIGVLTVGLQPVGSLHSNYRCNRTSGQAPAAAVSGFLRHRTGTLPSRRKLPVNPEHLGQFIEERRPIHRVKGQVPIVELHMDL